MASKPHQVERPRFEPVSCIGQDSGTQWVPLISCKASCPADLFETAIDTLVHHPEYNSTLILRSETISATETDFPDLSPEIPNKIRRQCIHRRLLPRRPGRDDGLDQYCTFYSDSESPASCIDTLVLTPIPPADGRGLPYYHPTVHHLAFRHFPEQGLFRIDVDPLPGVDTTDINARLYRTCLSLLETLHRYGWGAVSQFKKRVLHDRLVPREPYQDLYLVMRERHKHLVDTWQEATDPLKHVFEDIGIATFLILLWKDTYPALGGADAVNEDEPWKSWPRPPGGFLDLGCGNGLLTQILVSEGYEGYGVDVRARTSWSHYPESTQAKLRVHALEPHNEEKAEYFQPGVFLIGNHADELTPWVPLLATIHGASGYLSIPCCAWTFDARYERSMPLFPLSEHLDMNSEEFIAGLHLGGDGGNTSGYSMYRIWLASLSSHCGWEIECETLRIPSTRNWALVGRKKIADGHSNVGTIMQSVRERGVFKTRRPEGKAGEH